MSISLPMLCLRSVAGITFPEPFFILFYDLYYNIDSFCQDISFFIDIQRGGVIRNIPLLTESYFLTQNIIEITRHECFLVHDT